MEHDPDTLFLLVHRVARAFYEPRMVILMDALARSRELSDTDLAFHLHLSSKEVRTLIAILSMEKFVKQITKTEMGNHLKAYKKTYYYLDFRQFVQVVKFKMIKMQKRLSDGLKAQHENDSMYFLCKVCGRKYSMAEVVNKFDATSGNFMCHGEKLEEKKSDDSLLSVSSLEQKKKRLNDQIKPLLELAKETDNMKIPLHITSMNNAYLKPNSRFAARAAAGAASTEGSSKKYSFQDGQTPVTIYIIDEEAEKRKEEEKKILPLPWFQKIQTMFDDPQARLPRLVSEDDLQNSQASTEQGDEEKEDDIAYLEQYYDNISKVGDYSSGFSDQPRPRKRKFDDTESVDGSEANGDDDDDSGAEDESGIDRNDGDSDDEFEDVEPEESDEGGEDDNEEEDGEESDNESEMAVDTPTQ